LPKSRRNRAVGNTAPKDSPEIERARSAAREDIPTLLQDASEEALLALLENPRLAEPELGRLLERKYPSKALLPPHVRCEIAQHSEAGGQQQTPRRLAALSLAAASRGVRSLRARIAISRSLGRRWCLI